MLVLQGDARPFLGHDGLLSAGQTGQLLNPEGTIDELGPTPHDSIQTCWQNEDSITEALTGAVLTPSVHLFRDETFHFHAFVFK